MQSTKRTLTEKDTPEKAMDLSKILDRMREDQQQLDRKIAELKANICVTKVEEMKKL